MGLEKWKKSSLKLNGRFRVFAQYATAKDGYGRKEQVKALSKKECPHAKVAIFRICNICDTITKYVNVDKLLAWIEANLRANPPLNEHFVGYRKALEDMKHFILNVTGVKAVES